MADTEKNYSQHIEYTSKEGGISPQPAEITEYVEPPLEVQRKLLRKIDLRILPVMALLYLFSFLDRTNIGNAKIDGLVDELKLTNMQYNLCLTVFFFTYAAFEIPSNLCLKKWGAKRWIPFIMFWWGIVMTLMSLCQSYEGLLGARLALGLAEAGLFPGVTYYMTTWYKRSEIQFRVGVFFSAATIAGAFGGLLAYGIGKMAGLGGWEHGWRWIFAIEGIATVLLAIASYWMISDSPMKAKYLTPSEAQMLVDRVKYDGVAMATPMPEEFQWKYVVDGICDWKVIASLFIYWGSITPLYGIALFLPSIIKGLGYATTTAQLLTVPVYTAACVGCIIFAYYSDRLKHRSSFIIAGCGLSFLGYTIAFSTLNPNVRYFSMFLAAIGSYSGFPSVVAILTNNIGGKTKRATAIAIQIGVGGMGGTISSNIFRTQDAPHYKFGLAICMGLNCMGMLTAGLNYLALRIANKRKLERQARIENGEETYTNEELSAMCDRSPYFAYTL
ncbi:MFS general substrate transporter [Saitoella complicata NRRL Y-17804]|nr:MFS general substrate transporter [Saitoella complicata NRRL Y-17804]ODQ51705.1 MFS general substrate transporter [Saitoella complicata NRRL Y-17804]